MTNTIRDYTAEIKAGRPIDLRQASSEYEGDLMLAALDKADGSTRAAAKLLTIPESTLRYRLRQMQQADSAAGDGPPVAAGDPDTPPPDGPEVAA